jgi:hypothetical protein
VSNLAYNGERYQSTDEEGFYITTSFVPAGQPCP